ncbi:MAG: hypothetical protein QM817_30405 [Archangium sp.]
MNFLRALVLVVAVPALAQTWNSNAGGWNTGYGTVYGSFGYAMATQNIYQTSQMNMQRLIMRQAMIKKWGLAAVEEAERNAKAGKTGSNAELQKQVVAAPAPPTPKNIGAFKPGKSSSYQQLANTLGSTKEEKDAIALIGNATSQAFDAEPKTKAMRNNVAGAFTFFLVSNLTVASGQEEPSDEKVQALFQAINQALDANPDFAKTTGKQKQELYEMLMLFTGLPLAIAEDAKSRGDDAQLKQAQELAAKLIELVFKADPASMKF